MEITTDQLPTECLVCTDDNGSRITTQCDNPNCEDGVIYHDDDLVDTDEAG